MNVLALDGQALTCEAVIQVGRSCDTTITLAPEARTAVIASRAVVEKIIATNQVVYGINTGFGAMSHVTIPTAQLAELQHNLVRSHAAGCGPLMAPEHVRAMMVLRANALAKGVSGVRPEVIDTLCAVLNANIIPAVPSKGSLGASGDLAPLAHMALVLLGEGFVLDAQGNEVPAAPVLAQHGIAPLTLAAKEGLALLNGTQQMTALGVFALAEAKQLMAMAEVAGCMTIEAIQGSSAPFDARISAVRPHKGQAFSASLARAILADSAILPSHVGCGKVQDPYSLRCIPQVHGTVWEALWRAEETLTIEMNAATDNPLVFANPASGGDVISQGNFHGEPIAMMLDHMSIALAEIASIAERRIDKLMNPAFSGLPAFGTASAEQAGLHSGWMIAHYNAAGLVSENKTLAYPAVLDTIPTSNDKEDHVSMGGWAARKLHTILENARWVIATELVVGANALAQHQSLAAGVGVEAAKQWVLAHVPRWSGDTSPRPLIAPVAEALKDGRLFEAVCPVVASLKQA